jgi:hypothetical protein
VKAITLPQPLAALVVLGVKTLDARPYSTGHRGPLAIHAAGQLRPLHWDAAMSKPIRPILLAAGWGDPEALPLGAVVGSVRLEWVSSVESTPSYILTPRERQLGTYEPGRFVWRFAEPQRSAPIPVVGRPGGHLWDWTPPKESEKA